jgi:hypothetical protein
MHGVNENPVLRGRHRPIAPCGPRTQHQEHSRQTEPRGGHGLIAEDILAETRDVLYPGRSPSFPIALEGALKLKEISCIQPRTPTDFIFDEMASGFERAKARCQVGAVERQPGHGAPGQPGRRRHHIAEGRARGGADPLHHSGAAAHLPHGGRQGRRRRSAAQPPRARRWSIAGGAPLQYRDLPRPRQRRATGVARPSKDCRGPGGRPVAKPIGAPGAGCGA